MIFEKVKRGNGFDCYAFMVDYENMGLEWPDGYETEQMDGQAPVGVNDNYIFYAKNDELHMLDFGSFKEQTTPLAAGAGAAFNKSLEAVALKNEEKEQSYSQLENLITAIEMLTDAKHGDGMSDMHTIAVSGGFAGLVSKLSRNGRIYDVDMKPDELTPAKEGLSGLQTHISVDGQEVTLESVLDDIDGERFRPTLEKMQLANIDLYAVWADWYCVEESLRPMGYEGTNRCPVGINNNDIIFQMGQNIVQLNVLTGKKVVVPFDNIMPELERAANKAAAYFKEQNIELERFLGKLIRFGLYDTRNVPWAADVSDDMRTIWNFAYRMTTEDVMRGGGKFVSVRSNRAVTLEEMMETL